MRRIVSAWSLGLGVLALIQPALALVYVPGQHREDGVYIQPHFLPSNTRQDETWFNELTDPVTANKDTQAPATGAPPARINPAPDAAR